jgi:fluoroacetyl-CoA thioesterase
MDRFGWNRRTAHATRRITVKKINVAFRKAIDPIRSVAFLVRETYLAMKHHKGWMQTGESSMAKPVPMGARWEATETVEFQHTLTSHNRQLPPVYSTPDMIRLMEIAAFHALQPYCEGDEITVGTSIHVEHRAASGIGTRIKAEAAVESFDGRFYTVRVSASDGSQEIGRGTVGRAVVSLSKFAAKFRKAEG